MDIWSLCDGQIKPAQFQNDVIRVVESQEQIATNHLVDNFAEQDLLEHMLESSKPGLRENSQTLHYLLSSPFRYPPLQYGSRFGTRYEPSLFYGSHSITTALAETSYYRFLFWHGMTVAPPSEKFVTQHTIYSVAYATQCGLKLQETPFSQYQYVISDPTNYTASQKLGKAMRESGIELFEYISARDRDAGINVALFAPTVFTTQQPNFQQAWLCETNETSVSFYTPRDGTVYEYAYESFLIENLFPQPAV